MTWEAGYFIVVSCWMVMVAIFTFTIGIVRRQGRQIDQMLATWRPDPVLIAEQLLKEASGEKR